VARITGEAANLWEHWVAPLVAHLDGVEHLVVIPSGPLLGIPVEALVDHENEHLGNRYTVSYAPSATVYTWLMEQGGERKVPTARNALLVGDPPFTADHMLAIERESRAGGLHPDVVQTSTDPLLRTALLRSALAGHPEALASLPRLPWTRIEVEQVASLFPAARILLGADASEQRLTELAEVGALREYDTIHLATHAFVDDALPERSALVLSRANLPDPQEAIVAGIRIHDGLLTAKEIVREWTLDADLVTLSGCQTGLGRQAAGEGYIGLAHAFLQAGARSLLVSLWQVDEEATSLLMTRFYRNLAGIRTDEHTSERGGPMSKAEALRDAKRWLQNYTDTAGCQSFRHPTFWSGFVLIGEP
jgi:CHAT domain-containing protein